MGQITFKVAKLGQRTQEFFVENGDTLLFEALSMAGYTAEGYDVRMNGESVGSGSHVPNNATVTLIPKLKAGQ
jgi:hypothetical protein